MANSTRTLGFDLAMFRSAHLHLRLVGIGREEDQRPLPARRYPDDPRQPLEAMHPQAVQVDARRLRAEFAALCNYPSIRRFRIPAKYISGSVSVRTVLEGIPTSGEA